MKRLENELDTTRFGCQRERYFVISYLDEATLVFWVRFYNPTHFINRMIGSRLFSISEATQSEAETMEVIGDVPNLHFSDAEKWIDKKRYLNA